jgi:hypothetical protein
VELQTALIAEIGRLKSTNTIHHPKAIFGSKETCIQPQLTAFPFCATIIVAAILTLAVSAFIAAIVPAIRASSISPMQALRVEYNTLTADRAKFHFIAAEKICLNCRPPMWFDLDPILRSKQICSPFPNYYAGGHRVSSGDARKDGTIRNPEGFYTIHAQLCVND